MNQLQPRNYTDEELLQIIEDDLGVWPFDAAVTTGGLHWADDVREPQTIYAVLGRWSTWAFLGDNYGNIVGGTVLSRGELPPAMHIHDPPAARHYLPWFIHSYNTPKPPIVPIDLSDPRCYKVLFDIDIYGCRDWSLFDEKPDTTITFPRPFTVEAKKWGKRIPRTPPQPIYDVETKKWLHPPPSAFYKMVVLVCGFCPETCEWVVWGEPTVL
jgi:hypothetical protein